MNVFFFVVRENTLRKNQPHCESSSLNVDSERPSKLDDVCKKSHEISMDSLRLSKLASAFEESLRVSRDSDRSEGSSRSSVDSERPNNFPNTCNTSLDVSVMGRCLAAMTQSNSRSSSQEPEARDGLLADEDDDDDDEDCSSLLESLSDLQSQLQQEIRQTQSRLRGTSDRQPTTCEPKRSVEGASDSNTGVEDCSRSMREDATTSLCTVEDRSADCALATTTTTATTATVSSLPAATTKSTTRTTMSTTTGCCLL